MTDDELAEVRDFLISKKGLVRFYWNQSFDFWRAFKKEEVWVGYSWPDTVGYADAAGMNYLYMQPKEGRISWVCGMGLFADTQNYHHAHEYVDSWASKEAAEFLLAYYYYGHTNTEADLAVVPTGVRRRRSGSTTRRCSTSRTGHPRDVHPAAERLPAVLERGAGGLSRRGAGAAGSDMATTWRRPTAAPPEWRRRRSARSPRGCSAAPLLWLLLFFVIPVGFVAAYSVGAVALFPTDTGVVSLASWERLLTGGSVYMRLFWKSIRMSLTVSAVVVLLAYPTGYFLALCVAEAQVRAAAADHRPVPDELPAAGARVEGDPRRRRA